MSIQRCPPPQNDLELVAQLFHGQVCAIETLVDLQVSR